MLASGVAGLRGREVQVQVAPFFHVGRSMLLPHFKAISSAAVAAV